MAIICIREGHWRKLCRAMDNPQAGEDPRFATMADRAENLRRLAHVATLMADAGLTVLVPAISPLDEHRELARKVHDENGIEFFEVFVDTPLEDCERRDPKGLYAKARRGEITHFTGIDSPYQRPKHPDLRLTPDYTAAELAEQVVGLLDFRA